MFFEDIYISVLILITNFESNTVITAMQPRVLLT